jgi:lysozyme
MPSLLLSPLKTATVGEANMAYEIIKHFEDCRLEAYQDSAKIWTVGFGSTKNVKPGMKITQEEADRRLVEDLEDARLRVGKALVGKEITLTENEFEVLVSLAYNLRSFEQLVKHLPDRDKFKKKMLLYCKDVDGNYLKGLKIRRIAERLLFEGKEWYAIAVELQDRKKTIDDVKKREKELFV